MKRAANFLAQMINPQPATRKHSGNRHSPPGQNAPSKAGRLGRPGRAGCCGPTANRCCSHRREPRHPPDRRCQDGRRFRREEPRDPRRARLHELLGILGRGGMGVGAFLQGPADQGESRARRTEDDSRQPSCRPARQGRAKLPDRGRGRRQATASEHRATARGPANTRVSRTSRWNSATGAAS